MSNVDDTSKELEKHDIPTAVTVKPVLGLISAWHDKDEPIFKKYAMQIAEELVLNDKQELALYIYAQFGLCNTFEVTE